MNIKEGGHLLQRKSKIIACLRHLSITWSVFPLHLNFTSINAKRSDIFHLLVLINHFTILTVFLIIRSYIWLWSQLLQLKLRISRSIPFHGKITIWKVTQVRMNSLFCSIDLGNLTFDRSIDRSLAGIHWILLLNQYFN